MREITGPTSDIGGYDIRIDPLAFNKMYTSVGPRSPARVSQPLTDVLAHTLRLEVEEGGRTERTYTTQASALAGAL